jgi:phosphatidylinositol 3-kinase
VVVSEFRRCVVAAFQELRQHASLILNLLSLMADAGIPHLSGDVEATIGKVQEKFRLDLHGDEADRFILGLIDTSMNAMFPKVLDKLHSVRVALR